MPDFENTHEGRNAAQRGKNEDRLGEIVKQAVQDGIREELPRQFELIGLDVLVSIRKHVESDESVVIPCCLQRFVGALDVDCREPRPV